MRTNRKVAHIERLSELLRTGDLLLNNYASYETWLQALKQYRFSSLATDSSVANFQRLREAMADMIDEALEKGNC